VAVSWHPRNSPESARPVCSVPDLWNPPDPVNSADPTALAARAEPAHLGPSPAGRPRRTCRRGRRARIHWACRTARWGRTESGRRGSGLHPAARKGWPGRPSAGRNPSRRLVGLAGRARRADSSVRRPRSPTAATPGRVPSARRSLRPARRHRTVAGPDRRWPRWSPNRPSGSLTWRGRLATVPTPDVIPYQGWTHGWTCSELDLSTQNGASSTIPDAGRPLEARAGGRFALGPVCQAESAKR